MLGLLWSLSVEIGHTYFQMRGTDWENRMQARWITDLSLLSHFLGRKNLSVLRKDRLLSGRQHDCYAG